MAVPNPVSSWFKTSYAGVNVDPVWLAGCWTSLKKQYPTDTIPSLIKKAEAQLLSSSLSSAVILAPPIHLPAHTTISTVISSPSQLPPCLQYTSSTGLPDRKICTLDFGKAGVLVEVTSIYEVGHSSYSLEQVLQSRAAYVPKIEVKGKGKAVADQEKYPRSMLKLSLSDGRTTLEAAELSRIAGLELGETELGAKLLLVGKVAFRRGFLLLRSENVLVKGGGVEGKPRPDEAVADRVARQLGRQSSDVKPAVQSGVKPKAGSSTKPAVVDLDSDDGAFDDLDEDDLAALDAACTPAKPIVKSGSAAVMRPEIHHVASSSPALRNPQPKDDEDFSALDDDFDDELDLDGLDAVMKQAETKSAYFTHKEAAKPRSKARKAEPADVIVLDSD